MKTLTIPVAHLAQSAGGSYVVDAAYYTTQKSNPIAVQFYTVPAEMRGIMPVTIQHTLRVDASDDATGKITSPPTPTWTGYPSTEKLNLPNVPTGEYIKNQNAAFYGQISRMVSGGTYYGTSGLLRDINDVSGALSYPTTAELIYNLLENGMWLDFANDGLIVTSANFADIELTYDEGTQKTTAYMPSGYADPTQQIIFNWRTAWSGYPIETIGQTSATLRVTDTTFGSTYTYNISGSSTTRIFTAGAFYADHDFTYTITVNTLLGTSTASGSFTTREPAPTVSLTYPTGGTIDNTRAVEFSWKYDISTGTAQKAYTIYIVSSVTGGTYIRSATTAQQSHTVPAGTIPAGAFRWAVEVTSQGGTTAESEVGAAFAISLPTAPTVTVLTAGTRPRLTWTSTGQRAYQVISGDNAGHTFDSGIIVGTETQYNFPEYLSPGRATLAVRIMNQYGYWSEYGSAVADLENTEATPPEITGIDGRDAAITWQSENENILKYQIFRDGEKIAELGADAFIYYDLETVGAHQYFVREGHGTYYVDSDTVTVTATVSVPMIADVKTKTWLEMPYNVDQLPTVTTSTAADIYLRNFSARVYPVAEAGIYKSRNMQITAAFTDAEKIRKFENLNGKIVIYKNPLGDVIRGVIISMQKTRSAYYAVFSVAIEEVDDDAGN